MNDSITVKSMAEALTADRNKNGYKAKVYKEQTDEHKSNQVSLSIDSKKQSLQQAMNAPRVDLSNTQQVQERTYMYLEACSLSACFPSVMGLSGALGCSRQNLNRWLLSHPEHATTEFINMTKDVMADILTNASFYNNANAVAVFMGNERTDTIAELDRLANIYNPAVIAKERNRFNEDYEKLTAVVSSAFRKMISEFTEEKHKQVTKMVRTAPTESMRNLLETLKMRDDLDAVELHDIMPLFYESYHGLRALQSIARQNGITLNMPVQMDAVAMHKTIDKAAEYLNGAVGEMLKPKSKTTHYNDFFTVDDTRKDKIFAPVYEDIVAVLDTVPQLQDFTASKTALSPLEKARIDWYFRDVPENANKTQLAQYTKEIMEKHPDDVGIMKLSKFAEYVDIVEAAKDTE